MKKNILDSEFLNNKIYYSFKKIYSISIIILSVIFLIALITPVIHYLVLLSENSNAKFPYNDYSIVMTVLYPISILFLSLFTYNNNKINEIENIKNRKLQSKLKLENEFKNFENDFIEQLSKSNYLHSFPKIAISDKEKQTLISIYSLYLVKLINFTKSNDLKLKCTTDDKIKNINFDFNKLNDFINYLLKNSEDKKINYYDLVANKIDLNKNNIYFTKCFSCIEEHN